jgi:hypothetical protein
VEEEALASIACHKNQALSSAERRDIAVRAAKTRWTRLNDTGKFKLWTDVRATLGAEGYDSILVRRLEGDSYFKFRLGQRMRAAQREPNGC